MLTPDRLLRLTIEVIFILLGGIVAWLGLTVHIFFDRRSASWLILSNALLLWGFRALYRPGRWWASWENWTRGISLVLLGLLMFAISRVAFLWVGRLLAAVGVVLALRGLLGSLLIFRRA